MSVIYVAGIEYNMDDALKVIAGYAFGGSPSSPNAVVPRYGEAISALTIPVFGYRSYDNIPATPGSALEPIDILIASGLNGRIGVER